MMNSALLKSAAVTAALMLGTSAGASTINFSDGVENNSANTYVEDGYLFTGVRIVSGNCADDPATNPEKCAAENRNELITMTRVDAGAFSLSSIWFQLLGSAGDGNAFEIVGTFFGGGTTTLTFGNPPYDYNTGYTLGLAELGALTNLSKLTFRSAPDGGNLRIDNVGVEVIPLPAAGWLLLAGVGGLAAMRRKKAA
jgi:hypothetical protein